MKTATAKVSKFTGKPVSPQVKQKLDRTTACALVEAGYMPLKTYIELFGNNKKKA